MDQGPYVPTQGQIVGRGCCLGLAGGAAIGVVLMVALIVASWPG